MDRKNPNDFDCNSNSFAVGLNLQSSSFDFRSEVKHTNYCEEYQVQKIDSNLAIFFNRHTRKDLLFAANRSFEIEKILLGVLSIKVSSGFDESIKKLAEIYRKKNCPNMNSGSNFTGWILPVFFIIAGTSYLCYYMYQSIRSRLARFPTITQVRPFLS